MELHSSGSRSLTSACRRAAVVQEAFFRLQASYPPDIEIAVLTRPAFRVRVVETRGQGGRDADV